MKLFLASFRKPFHSTPRSIALYIRRPCSILNTGTPEKGVVRRRDWTNLSRHSKRPNRISKGRQPRFRIVWGSADLDTNRVYCVRRAQV